jgi:hypothetical protein
MVYNVEFVGTIVRKALGTKAHACFEHVWPDGKLLIIGVKVAWYVGGCPVVELETDSRLAVFDADD